MGVTIGIMAMLLVLNMPHPVKASTCTSSAMAGGAQRALFARNSLVPQARIQQPLADHGCSSASVANGGQGASCGAANNGQGAGFGASGPSCFASNQNVRAQPQAQSPTAFAANTR
jgi:hypothetical protein